MKMKPEEITAIIKQQIQDYDVDLNVDDVGTVLDVGDGIAHIYGLERAMAGELLEANGRRRWHGSAHRRNRQTRPGVQSTGARAPAPAQPPG